MSFEKIGKKGKYDHYTWERPCASCGKKQKGYDLYDTKTDEVVEREMTESECDC